MTESGSLELCREKLKFWDCEKWQFWGCVEKNYSFEAVHRKVIVLRLCTILKKVTILSLCREEWQFWVYTEKSDNFEALQRKVTILRLFREKWQFWSYAEKSDNSEAVQWKVRIFKSFRSSFRSNKITTKWCINYFSTTSSSLKQKWKKKQIYLLCNFV